MKKITVDGKDFNTYDGFMAQFSTQINYSFSLHSLDAFDDILYGGVVAEIAEDEEIDFVWKNSRKSKKDLNRDNSYPLPEEDQGRLFEMVVEIISDHDNIHLHLE